MRATGFFFDSGTIGVTRLAGNRFRNCGFDAAQGIEGIAYAIHVVSVADLALEGCLIMDTGISPDGAIRVQPARSIHAWAGGTAGAMIHGDLVGFHRSDEAADRSGGPGAVPPRPASFRARSREPRVWRRPDPRQQLHRAGFQRVDRGERYWRSAACGLQFDRVAFSNNHCWHFSRERNDRTGAGDRFARWRIGLPSSVTTSGPTRIFLVRLLGSGTVFMGNVTLGDVRAISRVWCRKSTVSSTLSPRKVEGGWHDFSGLEEIVKAQEEALKRARDDRRSHRAKSRRGCRSSSGTRRSRSASG